MNVLLGAGIVGMVAAVVAVVGIVVTLTVGKKKNQVASTATAFAAILLGLGGIGMGIGHMSIEAAVKAADPATQAMLTTIGAREAAGNLLIAGIGALILGVIALGSSLMGKSKPAA